MATWQEQLTVIKELRRLRNEQDASLHATQIALIDAEDDLKKVKRKETYPSGSTNPESEQAAEAKKIGLEQSFQTQKNQHKDAIKNLGIAINELASGHPRAGIRNLDDDIPFLLIPVRIETRFMTEQRQPELWIRIYPDDIAIHTHEKLLTKEESSEGEKYWKALFEAERTGAGNKESIKKQAWKNIVTLFGSSRSAWIARQTKPDNWSTSLNNPNELIFPGQGPAKPDSWSRAPRTTVMPDRFVAIIYDNDTMIREAVGNLIPDELIVGPDPLDPDAFLERNGNLVPGESYDWVSNFDKAVELGLGIKMPLRADLAQRGFDKLVVLGVSLSMDENDAKQELETLIDNHHYSPNGFSIVKQGTPTNNTERDGSGYTTNDPHNDISYFVETGNPLFEENEECDGRNLANALGIDYAPLQFILNSNAKDHKEAVAMNTALYASTIGFHFDTMLKLAVGEESQNQLRKFFIKHVTARGALPAIRVGDQPYGVLLTSDFSKWQLNRADASFPFSLQSGILNVLKHYHELWKSLLHELQFVGKPGTDPSNTLMNILGLQAGSVSFHRRVGYPVELLKNKSAFVEGGRYYDELMENYTSNGQLLTFLNNLGSDMRNENGVITVPPLLRLVFQNFHHSLDINNLIDKAPLSEKELLSNYDEENKKNYLHWLAETNTMLALEQQHFGQDIPAPNSLLYMQARRSLLLQLHNATVKHIRLRGFEFNQTSAAVNFYNIRPAATVTRWEVLKAKLETVDPSHPQRELSIAEHLLVAQVDEDEVQFLQDMRTALGQLANVPTSRLERCLTEHIDLCTYRLDAWQMGLFHQRLLKQRQLNTDGQQRKKGIFLAASAISENLRPSPRQQVAADTISSKLRPPDGQPIFEYADNGGFVHAPSLNHAMAAALLRSGYLAHANSDRPDAMAVNLSSERVRRAYHIVQGIRNGQTLEALLGYQFERGLHDRASADNNLARLNEFIYNFRDTFPIELHYIQQQGTTTTETIPANNVVNGVKLAEFTGAFPGTIISGASAAQVAAIVAERDKLNDSLDAIKDLFMSESVYHLVQGNFDRAGAVANAVRDANPPPEIDVINTPRSSHFTFTNRVTIQFENLDINNSSANPWSPVPLTPRAMMEPGLNKWLASILGRPESLLFRVSHGESDRSGMQVLSVDRLEIQPIDLIYMLGNELSTGDKTGAGQEDQTAVSEIESRIAFAYRKREAVADDVQVNIEFLQPATNEGSRALGSVFLLLKMLRSLITNSRHAHAEDFDSPSKLSNADKNNTRGYDANNLMQRVQQSANNFRDRLNELKAVSLTVDGTANNLETLLSTLQLNGKNLRDLTIVLSDAMAGRIQQLLSAISNFALPDAFPKWVNVQHDENKLSLLEQAINTMRRMAQTHASVNSVLSVLTADPEIETDTKISRLIDAGKKLLGDAFTIIPLFSYNNPADIKLCNEDRAQLLSHAINELSMDFVADEWMQSAAHVRPRLVVWDSIRTFYESMQQNTDGNITLELKPVQLPYRANDSWVAVEFPEKDANNEPFNILHDTLSVTIHGDAAFNTTELQLGLVVDDWTEMIPVKEETTGISFNYDQPNVSPAQVLMLAVPPVKTGKWSWETLLDIVNDTFLRAKLRAVEPLLLDKLDKPELGVLLPAALASYSTYDLDFALDYRMNVADYAAEAPIVALGKL